MGRNLKAVEFHVTEDAVVVLVGNVKYPGEGSHTQWFELGGWGGHRTKALIHILDIHWRAHECTAEQTHILTAGSQ